jgi:hypothetical protein
LKLGSKEIKGESFESVKVYLSASNVLNPHSFFEKRGFCRVTQAEEMVLE